MKVLLVNDFFYGGGAEEVFRYDGNLKAMGIEMRRYYASQNYETASSVWDYIFSIKNRKAFLAELRAYKPDIIHLHNYYHTLSPSILHAIRTYKKQQKVKVLFTAHDFHLVCPNSGMVSFARKEGKLETSRISKKLTLSDKLLLRFDNRGWIYDVLKKTQHLVAYDLLRLYDVFDRIVSPSFFLKSMLELQNRHLPKIQVVRNPVKLDFTRESIKENHDRKRHPSAPLRMIFTGRLAPEKALMAFVRLLASIDKRKFHLSVYGSGEESFVRQLEALIQALGLEKNVELKGYAKIEALDRVMDEMDVSVLMSALYENAPLSIIEACVKGLTSLTLNYGGMKEMAELSGKYVLFDIEDPSSLNAAIDHCLNGKGQQGEPDYTELEKMKHYDREIAHVYSDLLGNNR